MFISNHCRAKHGEHCTLHTLQPTHLRRKAFKREWVHFQVLEARRFLRVILMGPGLIAMTKINI